MARWAFGDFVLDLEARELLRSGAPVALSPKAFQLLTMLVENQARALSKSELQDRLWPGTFVVEKNLTNLVSEIREALGDEAAHPRYIRTVHRFGYAFREALAEDEVSGSRRGVPDPPGHNLPAQLTRFIGRAAEIAELERVVASTRLLTLTGAGGCGKTRLALELGGSLLDRFAQGVWVVDLAPLSDPSLLAQTVASALEVREGPQRSTSDALLDFVRNRQMLLILDNCEHLVAPCARLAETLLHSAGSLSIIATSREGLGIPGEIMWRVPSLSLPDPSLDREDGSPQRLLEYDAIGLFADRARAADPAFSLGPANAERVAEVCRRLDGIPLAIELAAARLRVLTIEQIHSRLNDRFRLLTGGSRTALARQRTLEAAVDWSYELLADDERELLRHLSVFAGGWTIEAAEAVTASEGRTGENVLNLLSRLVDKSLVNVDQDGGEDRRYRFLETVRQYARERLLHSGDAGRLRDSHLAFFHRLVRQAEPDLTGPRQVSWLNRLEREHDNLRLALDWCLAKEQPGPQSLDFASALCWFWIKRGYLREGQELMERALSHAKDVPAALRARGLMSLAMLTFLRGDFDRTRALAEESAATARACGDLAVVGFSRGLSALAAVELGDFEACARLAAEGQAAARASSAPWVEGLSSSCLAYLALENGDLERASRLHEGVLELSRKQGEKWSMGISLFDLALLRVVQGRYAEARALSAEGIAIFQEFNDRRGIAWCLGVFSGAEAAAGHAVRAARLRGAMEGLLDSIGAPVQVTYHRWIGDRFAGVMREALGDHAYAAALAEGRAMSLSRATRFALQQEGVSHVD